MNMGEIETGQDTVAIGYLGEGGMMNTYPRIDSDLSTGPVLAAGKRAATTGIVR
jgi:hypothetical protein